MRKSLHKKSYKEESEIVSLTLHQICTPLTAIRGYVSLIQEGNFGRISRDVEKALETINKITNNLVVTARDSVNK